jgi:preprotein translocase subunit YajC
MYWNTILADTAAPTTTTTATTAQSASPGQPTQTPPLFGNPIFLIIPLVLIMYFLMIRPQQQQSKQQAKLLAALKSGDKVITSSGIVGVVITIKDKTVSIRSADAKMEVTKASVTQILESGDDTASSS